MNDILQQFTQVLYVGGPTRTDPGVIAVLNLSQLEIGWMFLGHLLNTRTQLLWFYSPEWLQVIMDEVEIINNDRVLGACVFKPFVEARWRISSVAVLVFHNCLLECAGLPFSQGSELRLRSVNKSFDWMVTTGMDGVRED